MLHGHRHRSLKLGETESEREQVRVRAAMASKPPTKKRREDVKEDIQSLQFGEDFDKDDKNVGALFNAEVKVVV